MRVQTIVALMLAGIVSGCQGQQPAPRLTNGQATAAIRGLMGLPGIEVVLGTCRPVTKNADFPGQTACTLLAVSPGGTSETQADFHWNGKEWAATPSDSQSALPFPDPVLMDIHAGAKVDQNAGSIR